MVTPTIKPHTQLASFLGLHPVSDQIQYIKMEEEILLHERSHLGRRKGEDNSACNCCNLCTTAHTSEN